MILIPAYGRDYKTAADVRKDWEAGKDFLIADMSCKWNGSYTSIRDTEPSCPHRWDTAHSYIRFDKLAELTFIGVWAEPEADAPDDEWEDLDERCKGSSRPLVFSSEGRNHHGQA